MSAVDTKVKRPRGRPRKNATVPVEVAPGMIEGGEEEEVVTDSQIAYKNLEKMSLPDLIDKALTVFRVPLTPEMCRNKEAVISAILRLNSRTGAPQDFALDARKVNHIPEGWAKIILHKENTPGSMNYPHPCGVNGYICAIPRDVPVLVPIKIVDGSLATAIETVRELDKTTGNYRRVDRLAHPYQELGRTDGPDPRPNTTKQQRYAPRKAFRDKYGFWPNADELKEAIKLGVISVLAR